MKYLKLFEEINNEVAKKYPHLFNLFVDPQYIKEEDYEIVNYLLKDITSMNIKKPLYSNDYLVDVDGDVNLQGSEVKELPENLIVKGDLDLMVCENIEHLPKGLRVGGSLYLQHSSIKTLPDDLIVGEVLNLHNCRNIKELPKNLKVGKNLILSKTPIKDLPKDIKVGGSILR